MQLLNPRKRAAVRTARRGLKAYGSFKHTQGRLSARRRGRSRAVIVAAAGGAVAVGCVAASTQRVRHVLARSRPAPDACAPAAEPPPAPTAQDRGSDRGAASNGSAARVLTL